MSSMGNPPPADLRRLAIKNNHLGRIARATWCAVRSIKTTTAD